MARLPLIKRIALSVTGRRAAPVELPALHITIICSLLIFSISLTVRWLHWRDLDVKLIENFQEIGYDREAARIVSGGGILLLNSSPQNGDARALVHPPGYALIIAALVSSASQPYQQLVLLQIICDAACNVLIFIIAVELLPLTIALCAALLGAFSPHFAYYALLRTPDTIAILPLLIAIYGFVRLVKGSQLSWAIAIGLLTGLSCWLRPNALLLSPFLAAALLIISNRPRRLLCSALIVVVTTLVIAPITIRNYLLFERFVLISLGAGANLLEGIADYDADRRFGMPAYDHEVAQFDAIWHQRPDYARNQWKPDGIVRDKARIIRGLNLIRAHPGWFIKVMARRALFMLSYNRSGAAPWPQNTAIVPPVNAHPPSNQNTTIEIVLRLIVRAIQQSLYRTALMLPMIAVGLLQLIIGGRGRAVAIILIVPVYYLIFQSPLHTEYRYILAIHHFLFLFAAATVYSGVKATSALVAKWRTVDW